MARIPLAVLVTLVASASACDGMFGPDDELQTLRDRRRQFERQVGPNYVYEYRNVRFAIGPVVEPVRIRVRQGQIVSVESLSSGQAVPPDNWRYFETVEGVFRAIEDAHANGAASVQAAYDPRYGYPTNVYIDYDQRLADEEAGYQLSNLTPEGNQ